MSNSKDVFTVLEECREQIQEDLICFLSTQFDDDGQNDEVQRIVCDIVVSNFTKLISKEEV